MEPIEKNSEGYYKLGIFYCEENNKRLIIRNPNNRFCLNHANKWSYLIDSLFILIFILKMLVVFNVIR